MFARILYYAGVLFVKTLTKVMFRMDIVRHDNIPKGAKIFVLNHPTTSDPFIATTLTKGHAGILIKDILFDIPVFGRYLKWAGHIPVLPSRGGEAFNRALALLKKKRSVIVFIEGQITPDGKRSGKPHTGAVRLALLSSSPIVPVGIAVVKKNIKYLCSVIKGRKDIGAWYFKGPYVVTIGKSFQMFGNISDRKAVRILTDKLMENICKLAGESSLRLRGV